MKSRLRGFVILSLLVHLLLLALFSFQNQQEVISPIQVNLTEKKDSTSKSSSSSGKNKVNNNRANNNKKKKNNNQQSITKSDNAIKSKANATTKRVNNSVETPVKKNSIRKLVRNNQRLTTSRNIDRNSEMVKNVDNRLTINDSKDLARGLSTSANHAKNVQEKNGKDFDGEVLGGKSGNNIGDGTGFALNKKGGRGDNTSGGSSLSSKSTDNSGDGTDNLNWKGTGKRDLRSKSDLLFPKRLEGKGIDEEVKVSFKVTPGGKVFDIEVIKSSGYPELDSAVKDQVRSFRFNQVRTKKNNVAEYSYLFKLTEKK